MSAWEVTPVEPDEHGCYPDVASFVEALNYAMKTDFTPERGSILMPNDDPANCLVGVVLYREDENRHEHFQQFRLRLTTIPQDSESYAWLLEFHNSLTRSYDAALQGLTAALGQGFFQPIPVVRDVGEAVT